MAADRKARWKKEIDWLLSVTDYIVELVPSQQKSKDGTNMEVISLSLSLSILSNIIAVSYSLILVPDSTDYDNTTKKRSVHEHPSFT